MSEEAVHEEVLHDGADSALLELLEEEK